MIGNNILIGCGLKIKHCTHSKTNSEKKRAEAHVSIMSQSNRFKGKYCTFYITTFI